MPPTNVLDHLTPDEVIRLLERRPDGIVARAVIAALSGRESRRQGSTNTGWDLGYDGV
jgi:hypothetical protein